MKRPENGFQVMADRRAATGEGCVPRERHTAQSFRYAIAKNGRAAVMSLQPGDLTLRISGAERDYERIWVFDAVTGELAGTLECSQQGEVAWVAPLESDAAGGTLP